MDSLDDIAAIAAENEAYDPNAVVLIGSYLDAKQDEGDSPLSGDIKVAIEKVTALTLTAKVEEDSGSPSAAIAIIYAFAFEGHTYRLPKPRVMIVSGEATAYKSSKSGEASQTLRMWRMSKHDHSVSIEIESGPLTSLVLENNAPGGRSTTYAAHMQLAHRGGRLTDSSR